MKNKEQKALWTKVDTIQAEKVNWVKTEANQNIMLQISIRTKRKKFKFCETKE